MDKNIVSAGKTEDVPAVEEKRTFKLDSGEELYIKQPTAENIRQSDWIYSKIYNEAFLSGVTTASQMMEEMKKRGIISEEFEQDLADNRDRVIKGLGELANAKTTEEKETAAYLLQGYRSETTMLNQRVNGPLSNTCEQLAEDAKLDYLTSTMVTDGSGDNIWDSYDIYCADPDTEKSFKSRLEVMMFLRNVDNDFLENAPEQVALREVLEEREQEAARRIDLIAKEAEAAAEALDARKVARKKAVKKKTTKKTTKKKTTKKLVKKAKVDADIEGSEE